MLSVTPTLSASMVESLDALDPTGRGDDEAIVLQEAHHRMNNILTLLTASLRLDFASVTLTSLPEAIDRFEARILAFSELHRLLATGRGHGEIPVREYFECLCRALTTSILAPRSLRCEVNIEEGFIEAKRCERLGLVVAELVTNAAKHAFPSQETGQKDGCVRVDAFYRNGCWYCGVSDNGIGAADASRGCGAMILEGLTRSMGANMIAESSCRGTTITIILPNSE
jgi:two-component sensor histidine kinase